MSASMYETVTWRREGTRRRSGQLVRLHQRLVGFKATLCGIFPPPKVETNPHVGDMECCLACVRARERSAPVQPA